MTTEWSEEYLELEENEFPKPRTIEQFFTDVIENDVPTNEKVKKIWSIWPKYWDEKISGWCYKCGSTAQKIHLKAEKTTYECIACGYVNFKAE